MDELLVRVWDYVNATSFLEKSQLAVCLAIVAISVAVVSRDWVTILTTLFLATLAVLATISQVGEISVSVAAFAVPS